MSLNLNSLPLLLEKALQPKKFLCLQVIDLRAPKLNLAIISICGVRFQAVMITY
jgi:hypothetical protein